MRHALTLMVLLCLGPSVAGQLQATPQVQQAVPYALPRVAFQARRSADYNSPDNTPVDVQADVVELDTHDFYDETTFRFQPTLAGWYEIGIQLIWLADARTIDHADIQAWILRNGAQVGDFEGVFYSSDLPTWDFSVGGTRLVYLDGVDDHVSWGSYHSSWDADDGVVSGSRSTVSARLVAVDDRQVIFQAHGSGNWPSPNNAMTTVPVDVVEVDTHGFFDPNDFSFKPTVAGWYEVTVNLTWLDDARLIDHADISAWILKNGAQEAGFEGVFYASDLPTWDFTSRGSKLVHLDGTSDVLSWGSYHSSWDADGGEVSGSRSWVSVELVVRD